MTVRKADKNLDTLSRGNCFGEMGFIAGVKRTATIVSLSDVIVMKVTSSLIDKASVNCQLRFKDVFLNTMVRRLSNADNLIAERPTPSS